MGISFAKKSKGSTPKATPDEEEEKKPSSTSKPPAEAKAKKKKKSSVSWMKRGADAKQALVEEEAKAEKAKAESGKMWRFWMPPDEERKITFLDGDLDDDGMLDIPMYHEHGVKVNGQWTQYVCTMESEGFCPLCERGDSKPALVGVMTIIDHTPYTVKSGKNAGKKIKDTRKMFVAKKQTIRLLSKMAVKREGLTGCTFDVMRGDDKTAAVGSQFDFDEKRTLADLREAFELDEEGVTPADYGEEITYHTADELVDLGLGHAPSGPGYENSKTTKNMDDEL